MANIVNEVNEKFKEILESYDDPYQVYQDLQDGMLAKNCTFGKGPMPIYVKPYFIDGARMPEIRYTMQVLDTVMNKVSDLYYLEPDMRKYFYLEPNEEELVKVDPGYRRRVQINRNDAFMTDDSLQYIEFNADSPGGPRYSDIQGDIIQQSEAFGKLAEHYDIGRDLIMWQVLRSLITCYREWGGTKEKPCICISAGAGGGTNPEMISIINWFKELGFDAEFVHTTEWSTAAGKLVSPEGRTPDIIYRRGWIGDWKNNMEAAKPAIDAVREHRVCIVNPFNSILAANKSIFALLQMEDIQKMLTDEEVRVVKEYLPWTRVFEGKKAEYKGKKIDLLEYVKEHKDKFVLKPINQYGGKDVAVGYACTDAEWGEWCAKAVGNFVVQEAVDIPEEELPTYSEDKKLQWSNKKINVNFYVYGGIYTGGVVRSSDSPIINVHKGGGMTPIMFVHSRKWKQ